MVHFRSFFFYLPVWTLAVSVRTVRTVRAEVSGQPQVIGSSQPIVASPGDDIILPCHLEPRLNVERLTVEWSRPDLQPDALGRVDYVHLYRDRKEVLDMKIRSYERRTALFPDQLKDGNVSLRIRNVTPADGGRYRCFIPKLKSSRKASVVQLVIKPRAWTTETPRDLQTPEPTDRPDGRPGPRVWIIVPVLVLVLGLGAGFAAYFFKKYQKPKLPTFDVTETKPLSV